MIPFVRIKKIKTFKSDDPNYPDLVKIYYRHYSIDNYDATEWCEDDKDHEMFVAKDEIEHLIKLLNETN